MWEEARASAHKFQVSTNGKTWTNVYPSDSPQIAYDAITFAPVTAHWVRVLGEKRNTNFGHSLFALDVYGDMKGR